VIPLLLGAVLVVWGYFIIPVEVTATGEFTPTLTVAAGQGEVLDGLLRPIFLGSILMIVGAILTLAYAYFEVYSSVIDWSRPGRIWQVVRMAFAFLVAITAFQVGGPSIVWLAVGVVVVLLIFGSYYLLVGKGFPGRF
jgi:hypothetical protein